MIDKTKALAKPYEPTTRERAALEAQHDRRRRHRFAPNVKISAKNQRVDNFVEPRGQSRWWLDTHGGIWNR